MLDNRDQLIEDIKKIFERISDPEAKAILLRLVQLLAADKD